MTGGRARRPWGPRASTPTAKKLTAPRAVEISQAGYALSAYTINDGDVARALVGMGVDCIITDAPDVILQRAGLVRRRQDPCGRGRPQSMSACTSIPAARPRLRQAELRGRCRGQAQGHRWRS